MATTLKQIKEHLEKEGFKVIEATDWVDARNQTCSQSLMYHTRRVFNEGFVMYSPSESLRGPCVAFIVPSEQWKYIESCIVIR